MEISNSLGENIPVSLQKYEHVSERNPFKKRTLRGWNQLMCTTLDIVSSW